MNIRFSQLFGSSLLVLTGLVGCSLDCSGPQKVTQPVITSQSVQVPSHNRANAKIALVVKATYDFNGVAPRQRSERVIVSGSTGCGRHSYSFEVAKDTTKTNTYNVTVLDEDLDNSPCEAALPWSAVFYPKDFEIPSGATVQFVNGPAVTLPLQ